MLAAQPTRRQVVLRLTQQQRETIKQWARAKYNRDDAGIRTVRNNWHLDIVLPVGRPEEALAQAEAWQARMLADAADWELVVSHHAALGMDIPDGWEWRSGQPMLHGAPNILIWRNMVMAARIWQEEAK